MTRIVSVTVLVILAAASRVADADTLGNTLPNSAMITFSKLAIDDGQGKGTFFQPEANSTDLLRYFNFAHCTCAKASPTSTTGPGAFQYLVQESASSGIRTGAIFIAGSTCSDTTHLPGGGTPTCTSTSSPLTTVGDIDNDLFTNGGTLFNFNLYQIVNADKLATGDSQSDCEAFDNVTNQIWMLASTTGGSTFDFAQGQSVGQSSTSTTSSSTTGGIDTLAPLMPTVTSISAQGGDGAIHLTWTPQTNRSTDIAHFQALCSTVDNQPAGGGGDAEYVTAHSVCGATTGDPTLVAIPVDSSDTTPDAIGAPDPSTPFGQLDHSFICATSDTPTAGSLDIQGLANGTPYKVILLTIDLHGNYSGGYFTSTITPVPSTDFWEDLHDRGSGAQGGLCLLAKTYGDDNPLTGALRAFRDDTLASSRIGRWLTRAYYATGGKLGGLVQGSLALRVIVGILLAPPVAFALLWHWLALPGLLALLGLAWWLRRHRRAVAQRLVDAARAARPALLKRFAALAAPALVVLAASPARAGGHEAYWDANDTDDQANQSLADSIHDPTWHVGIRVGPYVPAIDKQFSGTGTGPYKQMFGGYQILPMLDVDRFLWSGFGQVGVGISLGYMQKTASSFSMNSSASDADRERAADKNAFHLIPTSLTATYRFTWFDDEYGVPLVPYVRGGLSYYIWWITVDNGDFAKVCKDGGMEPVCSQSKAYGASLGVEGAVGLAIRAERIDASAAMSMRQSGIEHAGIYGEISAAKVDGFGSDKKLSVGDTTWFAGVEFEF